MSQIDFTEYEKAPGDPLMLIALSKQCLDQGLNDAAVLFARCAVDMAGDNASIRHQANEKIAIAGFYSKVPSRRKDGGLACESLGMDPCYANRYLAGQNGTWYSKSAAEIMPSTRLMQVGFTPPDDYQPMNPSIIRWNDQLWMVQRTVNYIITPSGHYDMRGDTAIRTRNWLLRLNQDLSVASADEILPPIDMPEPLYDLVIGFEDSRLFVWRDQLWTTSTVRELNQPGYCQIVLARIDHDDGKYRYADWRVITPQGLEIQHQKNWMPLVIGDDLRFIYSSDPVRIVDDQGQTVLTHPSPVASDSFRGGSQAMRFDDGWLAIIHESFGMSDGRRRYMHRFVRYDQDLRIQSYTPMFHIANLGIEFAAGLATDPTTGELIVSFGAADRESWLAIFDPMEVRSMLRTVPSMYADQADYIRKMDSVYGWLLPSAAEIISHTMYLQTKNHIQGDVLEIGTFHGRLFTLLTLGCQEGETSIGIDLFEDQHLNQDQSGFGFSQDILMSHLRRFASHKNALVMKLDSTAIGQDFIDKHNNIRWMSIDGSHTLKATASDLRLAEKIVIDGGIVAVDDIYRVAWAGVTAGVYDYLSNGGSLIPFALIPNKLLFTTSSQWAERYKHELDLAFRHYHAPHNRQKQEFFGDHEILLLKDPSDP